MKKTYVLLGALNVFAGLGNISIGMWNTDYGLAAFGVVSCGFGLLLLLETL